MISNILMVNIFIQDIGRFNGSNYNILKTIFELNALLFNTDQQKKIIFIIRDFDKQKENLESIEKKLDEDMQKIWKECKKPVQLEQFEYKQFLQLQIVTLSHAFYEKEKFIADLRSFKSQLVNDRDPNYLFGNIDLDKNVAYDSLGIYMQNIWQTIQNNKELNLPSQKIMISNFRCQQIKD